MYQLHGSVVVFGTVVKLHKNHIRYIHISLHMHTIHVDVCICTYTYVFHMIPMYDMCVHLSVICTYIPKLFQRSRSCRKMKTFFLPRQKCC